MTKTINIIFLRSESDISSLLHFGCLSSKITNSLLLFPNILLSSLEYFLTVVLFKNSLLKEKG